MKLIRTFLLAFAILLAVGCAKEYDDTAIKDRVNELEELIQENANAIRKLGSKLDEAVVKGMTVSVTPVTGGNRFTFSDGTVVTVMDGVEGDQGPQGQPGDDGADAVVTVKDSADGSSYIITMNGKEYTIRKGQFFSLKLDVTELAMTPGESEVLSYTLTDADETTEVFVNACSGYTAEVDMTASKVTVTAPAELPDNGFVIITARKNSTGEESSQYIGFLKGKLTVTADAETVAADGGTVTLTINADCDYVVVIPENCTWIEQVDKKSITTSYVYLQVAKNRSRSPRSAIVAISSSSGDKLVMISQKGSDAAMVPVVSIDIEDGASITSKDYYRNISLKITEGDDCLLEATGRAKGRGNATWINYPKKPYKVKFDSKQSVFGFPANKDWVLLAEYCDKSFLRTAYLHELSRLADVAYPINYRHVQLYMNDQYMGLYVWADQVEKKTNRVDIADDGFLFENDNHYYNEPLNFKTSRNGYYYTFKYPDPEDGEIASGDENYNFIKGFMNDFETALYGSDFKDPENGYRKFIDPRSFAKWFLVQELIGNLDTNMYYVLKSRQDKLVIGPLWDAEWSLGLAYTTPGSGWAEPPTQPDSEQAIWSEWKYFGRLFEDPYFVGIVKEEWEKLRPLLPAFRNKMADIADSISEDQKQNFEKWDILDKIVSVELVCNYTWEAEVEYAADFFDKRVDYLTKTLQQMSAE